MKHKCYLLMSVLSISLLAGCGNQDSFSSDKLVVNLKKDYQIWDTFNYSDISVAYNKKELSSEQFTIDLSGFDTSKVGPTSFKITLSYEPSVSKIIEVNVSKRKECSFLAIGNKYSFDLINFAPQIISNSDEEMHYSFSALIYDDIDLKGINNSFLKNEEIFDFYQFNATTLSWDITSNKSIKSILDVGWDIVSIGNNAFGAISDVNVHELDLLIGSMEGYLLSQSKNVPTFAWHESWAYKDNFKVDTMYYELFNNSQQAMYNRIKEVGDTIKERSIIDLYIPSGTAIQKARATTIKDENDFTTYDGIYLDEKGTYLAALDLVCLLSNYETSHFAYRGSWVSELEKLFMDLVVQDTLSPAPNN